MLRNKRFKGKVIIVTGAAQGIGRGVALQIAKESGRVVLVDRSDYVNEVAQEIKNLGGKAIAIRADLEAFSDACQMVEQTLKKYKKIDILINNVGGAIWMKPFEEFTEHEIIQEINRSLFPTLWCCRAVLPSMINQQSGIIVNISSIATRGINRLPYSAAKGGINALTASLAFEHAKNGIRVNAVATGGTEAPPRKVPRNTQEQSPQDKEWMQQVIEQTIDRTFLGRYGTIDEQVNAILFLASDESSYITGTVVPVGGGDQG
ncbi:1,2-dihydroxycyclohexa-3,5-diene-1-carboxylate dehydrogenase [Moraxella cuniculi DSM 21768]|uniref:1,2-dihydroxycyclohexa-3,5-diene-1-carboxylate dehydrogenase n=1 Tax=Moraxella cuniculi DSM 21768 TaxID=1122245 RepID=A0A1N7FI54_9GAMM|nr:1,6-dihydroxycyclohexa-2,4-diene-1-carboxylate dehydrogenase [Moraxella cuniculi]OOS02263.1 1,6-dihydroxycyclohexa-2,4-diene-1-carboxylate dehydrogenase [Moraxella cuniculi]SIS00003.1 1,2-dihydroxycyclohexa-3,5-diene-1-carboxylate dehydrogenase [Moraxella cuniculi DSM 21768]